jgi:iron complex transport system ATP-binding protein
VIELAGVTVRYGETAALQDVTLRAGDGEWVGVIGPNGAGKTTLLRCVARLVRHSGRVSLDGRATATLSRRELARMVAFVPQEPVFPADMFVLDYVLLGRTPYIGYLRSETAHDRRVCAELMQRLALEPLAGRRVSTLSGGERQRLVLARSLAQQAPVLVLDEPTSALDLGRRVEAMELVDQVRREQNLTVLAAMHDLTLAAQFADRLLLLAAGRLVALGPPAGVVREEVLAPLFGAGVSVLDDGGVLLVVSRRAAAARRAGGDPGWG